MSEMSNEKQIDVQRILFDIKHEIHDKAVYPHSAGINPYISIKTIDAILQNHINKYRGEQNHESDN